MVSESGSVMDLATAKELESVLAKAMARGSELVLAMDVAWDHSKDSEDHWA
jgi:hypothetical protein